MKLQFKPANSLLAMAFSTLLLAGCGGAPNSGDSDNDGGINQDDLVDFSKVPTFVSLSLADPSDDDAFTKDGVQLDAQVIAGNPVGHATYDGLVAEFVSPQYGVIDESCVIDGTGCSVTWTSGGTRPDSTETESLLWLMVMLDGGAEDFEDDNGNELYDDDETYTDLPEPYIDYSWDGVRDVGEYFVDLNGNGEWDGPNGEWDGPCSLRTGDCTGNSSTVLFEAWAWDIITSDDDDE